ncbi:chordin-like isoform X2 [Biomphalaria glabrata]|uniref:Chordin-like isoform X2 n=1 Tax=Biomphalaria glabrata TaxID=6526 RepID=A0A2C9M821_BIOGL|nr:chordin-like isoform X2 [Biomphalaria glabrata]
MHFKTSNIMLNLIHFQIAFPVTLVVTLSCLLRVVARSSSETCSLGGHVYQVGETWHPELDMFGKNCINCTCLPGGETDCKKHDCPKPECEEPKVLKGQCCPTCGVGTDTPQQQNKKKRGCDFQDEHYEHREVFPSNKTALAPKQDQCVLCECYNGDVICHIKKCVKTPGCKHLIEADDDCCLQCAMVDVEKPKAKADCVTNTGIQENGTTWKPIIVSYGEMKCVECLCLNGNVSCWRLKCPENSNLECDDPLPDQDGCCRECPMDKKKKRKKKENSKANCKHFALSGSKTNCLNIGPKRGNKKSAEGDSVLLKPSHVNDVINKLCLPKSAEKLVYYSKGNTFISLTLDDYKNNTIYQTYWELKNNRIQTTENHIITTPDEFRKSTPLTDILGGIDSKTEKAFWKKLNKRQRRCKKKCRRKLLETSIIKLKVTKIDFSKKKCSL